MDLIFFLNVLHSSRGFFALRALSVVLGVAFFVLSLYTLAISLPESSRWHGFGIVLLGFFPFFIFLSFQGLLSRVLPHRLLPALAAILFPYIFFFAFFFDVQTWRIDLMTFSLAEYFVTISAMALYAVRELRKGGVEMVVTAGIPYFFLCVPGLFLLWLLVHTWWSYEGATLQAFFFLAVILSERFFFLFPRLWREIERA